MTRAATPRPWHISRHDSGLIVGPGNEEPLVAGDADERDAALIVRAVNAHDDLVGALRELVSLIPKKFTTAPAFDNASAVLVALDEPEREEDR